MLRFPGKCGCYVGYECYDGSACSCDQHNRLGCNSGGYR